MAEDDLVSVFIGMPAHRPIPVPTVLSLLGTVGSCMKMGLPITVAISHGMSSISAARNHCAALFLQSDFKYLFWIDSDMEWRTEDFLKVLKQATAKDVARAAYRMRKDEVIFDLDGLGFCCVSRKVMEALDAQEELIWYGGDMPTKCKEIFCEAKRKSAAAEENGAVFEFMAEDAMFFLKVRSLGFETWIDPEIVLGHVGEAVYRGALKKADLDAERPGP